MNDEFPVELPKEEITEASIVLPGDVDQMVGYYSEQVRFTRRILREGIDFGTIPGTKKATLYKPGAEKFQKFNNFTAETILSEHQEHWDIPTADTFPLFVYRYTTKVFDRNGLLLNTCDGSANSYEERYRWRWMKDHEVPERWTQAMEEGLLETKDASISEFQFAIEKRKTTGPYGKPDSYWDELERLVEAKKYDTEMRKTSIGESICYIFSGTLYKVPNDRIFDQVNTIQKIAIKRSYVGAIIMAAMASEFYTQDLDDIGSIGEVEEPSIFAFVPDKNTAARELIRYATSKGHADAGEWIKSLLEEKEIEWSMDNWTVILKAIDEASDVEE